MAEPVVTAPPAAEDRRSGGFVSVTHDGVEIQSNTGTEEQLRAELGLDQPPVEPAEKPRARSRHENPTARMIEATRIAATAKRERDEALADAKRIKDENDALKAAAARPPAPPLQEPAQPVQSPPQPVQPAASALPAEDPEPKIEDFKAEADPYTAWIFARNTWGTRQEIRKASQQTSEQWAAYHEAVAWEGRLEAAEKKAPGLKAKLLAATVGVDRRVMPYIRSQDYGPAVLEYLQEHQDIAQRLTTLHPVEQIGQIGEIIGSLKMRTEAAVNRGSAPPPPPVSQARPPIRPPAGVAASAASDEPPGEDATPEEHERYWGPIRKRYR